MRELHLNIINLSFFQNLILDRRVKMTKSEVKSVPQKQVYPELDFAQSTSSFTLEHCYQKISKGSNSLNESPYSIQKRVLMTI